MKSCGVSADNQRQHPTELELWNCQSGTNRTQSYMAVRSSAWLGVSVIRCQVVKAPSDIEGRVLQFSLLASPGWPRRALEVASSGSRQERRQP